jgi:hypothetical protein
MPRGFAARLALIAFASAALFAQDAHAQDRDPAAAEALFAQARELMNAQRFAEACPKLAESERLDPGVGTEFHLAVCYEHEGKIASAWAAFRQVASVATASGQQERATAASRRAALLEPRLPRLQIMVPDASRASGFEITRDGIGVGAAQWGVALPIDPGAHQVEVTAPGRRAAVATVRVDEGATTVFEVPVLQPVALAAAPVTPAPMSNPAPAPRTEPLSPAATQPSAHDSSSGPGALVIGLGIAGILGVGAGAVLGVLAMSKNKESKDHCETDTSCDPKGVALRDDAFTLSDGSTVGFIVGGAALAAAGVVWLLRGDSEAHGVQTAIAVHAGPNHGYAPALRGGAAFAADVMLKGRF